MDRKNAQKFTILTDLGNLVKEKMKKLKLKFFPRSTKIINKFDKVLDELYLQQFKSDLYGSIYGLDG